MWAWINQIYFVTITSVFYPLVKILLLVILSLLSYQVRLEIFLSILFWKFDYYFDICYCKCRKIIDVVKTKLHLDYHCIIVVCLWRRNSQVLLSIAIQFILVILVFVTEDTEKLFLLLYFTFLLLNFTIISSSLIGLRM